VKQGSLRNLAAIRRWPLRIDFKKFVAQLLDARQLVCSFKAFFVVLRFLASHFGAQSLASCFE